MTISRREGLFEATLSNQLLSVKRYAITEAGATGGVLSVFHTPSPLFMCSLTQVPWFVVHSDGLYARSADDTLTPLYRGEDAAQLLNCLTDVLTTAARRRRILKVASFCMVVIALALLAWFAHLPLVSRTLVSTGLLSTPGAPIAPVYRAHQNGGRVMQAAPARQSPPPVLISPPVGAPADGWNLPMNVRAELPDKLRNAASRGLFTVPLSSGHARTIYVFADPVCPNCQRMERHFETAAGAVNLVIFPVTIEGRETALQTLTSVMALPEAERAAAWKQLFAVNEGVSVPGAAKAAPMVTDNTQAETARGAIGVNEVAFRAYRLPGTPWSISDDGRYVPQSVLSSPAALMAFLNGGDHDGQ